MSAREIEGCEVGAHDEPFLARGVKEVGRKDVRKRSFLAPQARGPRGTRFAWRGGGRAQQNGARAALFLCPDKGIFSAEKSFSLPSYGKGELKWQMTLSI
jgi:hypothetical protein